MDPGRAILKMVYKIKATLNNEGKIIVKEKGLLRFLLAPEFRKKYVSMAKEFAEKWGGEEEDILFSHLL